MEAEPDGRITYSASNLQHSACIQAKKVTCARVSIQDNTKKITRIFGLCFAVGDKDGLARGVAVLFPKPGLLRLEVDFCNGVKEG